MHAEFGGVNSIFTYYTRHNIWGFLSIAQNSCQKSPRIHLRKKNVRQYSSTALKILTMRNYILSILK